MMDLELTSAQMLEALLAEMENFIRTYRAEKQPATDWKTPVLGFAAADHPRIRSIREQISPTHNLPEDILPGCTGVLVYFLPFAEEIGRSNEDGLDPSGAWGLAYKETNALFPLLNAHLIRVIEGWGYHGVTPPDFGVLGEDRLYSNWSHRHMACAAGIGTFGLNNMLITGQGSCGRCFSLVTDLPLEQGKMPEEEYCLYKRDGSCGLCVERCPVQALSKTEAFDRLRCHQWLQSKLAPCGVSACGKCVAGMPCTFQKP